MDNHSNNDYSFVPNASFSHDPMSSPAHLKLKMPNKGLYLLWMLAMVFLKFVLYGSASMIVESLGRTAPSVNFLLVGLGIVLIVAILLEGLIAYGHFKALAYMNRFQHPVFYGFAYVFYLVFFFYAIFVVPLSKTPMGPLPPQKMPIKGLTLTMMGINLAVALSQVSMAIRELQAYGLM